MQEEEEINFRSRQQAERTGNTIKELREQVDELQNAKARMWDQQGLKQLRDQLTAARALVRWMFDRLGTPKGATDYSCSNQTYFQTGAIRQMTDAGMKIDAIRLAREHSDRFNIGPGLREAAEWVEGLNSDTND